MTNTDGVYVNGRQIDSGDCSGPKSARNVLLHPEVDAAVFETARGGILREGLGFDRCQVAVVTNIGAGDHLGLNYITTVEDLAVLKRVIVQNVADHGYAVLNAADPIVAAMAPACPGSVIFFASRPPPPRDGHAPRTGPSQPSTWMATPSWLAEGSWRESRSPARRAHHPQRQASASRSRTSWPPWLPPGAVDMPWEVIRRGLASFVERQPTTRPAASTSWTTRAPP